MITINNIISLIFKTKPLPGGPFKTYIEEQKIGDMAVSELTDDIFNNLLVKLGESGLPKSFDLLNAITRYPLLTHQTISSLSVALSHARQATSTLDDIQDILCLVNLDKETKKNAPHIPSASLNEIIIFLNISIPRCPFVDYINSIEIGNAPISALTEEMYENLGRLLFESFPHELMPSQIQSKLNLMIALAREGKSLAKIKELFQEIKTPTPAAAEIKTPAWEYKRPAPPAPSTTALTDEEKSREHFDPWTRTVLTQSGFHHPYASFEESGFTTFIVQNKEHAGELLHVAKGTYAITTPEETKSNGAGEAATTEAHVKCMPWAPPFIACSLGGTPRIESDYKASNFEGKGEGEINLPPTSHSLALRRYARILQFLASLEVGDEKALPDKIDDINSLRLLDDTEGLEGLHDLIDLSEKDWSALEKYRDCVQVNPSSNNHTHRLTYRIRYLYAHLERIAQYHERHGKPAFAAKIRQLTKVQHHAVSIRTSWLAEKNAEVFGEVMQTHTVHVGACEGGQLFEHQSKQLGLAKPTNVIFGCDISSSMGWDIWGRDITDKHTPSRLTLMVDSIKKFLQSRRNMQKQHASLTTFDGSARVIQEVQCLPISGQCNEPHYNLTVNHLPKKIGAGTDTLSGFKTAYSCAKPGFKNTILLITDGATTVIHDEIAQRNADGSIREEKDAHGDMERLLDKEKYRQVTAEIRVAKEKQLGDKITVNVLFIGNINAPGARDSVDCLVANGGSVIAVTSEAQMENALEKLLPPAESSLTLTSQMMAGPYDEKQSVGDISTNDLVRTYSHIPDATLNSDNLTITVKTMTVGTTANKETKICENEEKVRLTPGKQATLPDARAFARYWLEQWIRQKHSGTELTNSAFFKTHRDALSAAVNDAEKQVKSPQFIQYLKNYWEELGEGKAEKRQAVGFKSKKTRYVRVTISDKACELMVMPANREYQDETLLSTLSAEQKRNALIVAGTKLFYFNRGDKNKEPPIPDELTEIPITILKFTELKKELNIPAPTNSLFRREMTTQEIQRADRLTELQDTFDMLRATIRTLSVFERLAPEAAASVGAGAGWVPDMHGVA